MKKLMHLCYRFPILISLFLSICAGYVISIIYSLTHLGYSLILLGLILGIFIVYPCTLTICNIFFLLIRRQTSEQLKAGKKIEAVTFFLGAIYSIILIAFVDIKFVDWQELLYNSQKHTPVATHLLATVLFFCAAGVIGYLIVRLVPLKKLPPLWIVLSISGMYLFGIENILWIVQVWNQITFFWFLLLLPLNCLLIIAKVVKELVQQWNALQKENLQEQTTNIEPKINHSFMQKMNQLLSKSVNWPWMAFVLMLPLAGIFIMILALFGQAPDSFVKAWTDTSDWNLSLQKAPPNIMYDEHYLCTVAAGGHAGIVKPLRMGERHGHVVTVNRQLCIANAFEQILEEKTPKFHRFIRSVYDSSGYPIARHIRTKTVADVIYILMKPLEWCFLMVIYLSDSKPENRIAMQYLPESKN